VLDRCQTPYFIRKSLKREVYLDDLATRSGDPDMFIIEGFEGRYYKDHSEFSRAVDVRIDFEQVILQMAEKYMDSHEHLIALYYVTTTVKPDDAASLAGRGGTRKSWWLSAFVKPIREEIAQLLGMFVPTRLNWKKKFIAGDEDPFWQVVDTYKGRQQTNMVEVLCGLVEHESCKSMQKRLNKPKHMIFMYRRNAHEALRKAYNCSA